MAYAQVYSNSNCFLQTSYAQMYFDRNCFLQTICAQVYSDSNCFLQINIVHVYSDSNCFIQTSYTQVYSDSNYLLQTLSIHVYSDSSHIIKTSLAQAYSDSNFLQTSFIQQNPGWLLYINQPCTDRIVNFILRPVLSRYLTITVYFKTSFRQIYPDRPFLHRYFLTETFILRPICMGLSWL